MIKILFYQQQNSSGVVLVPYCAYKYVPTAISSGIDILEVPECHMLWQMSSWESHKKLCQGLVFPFVPHFTTQWNSNKESFTYYIAQRGRGGVKPNAYNCIQGGRRCFKVVHICKKDFFWTTKSQNFSFFYKRRYYVAIYYCV